MARRILLLITDLEIGGTPTVVRELAMRLHGCEIEVACLSKWGPVADQLRTAQVEVTALGANSPRDVWVIRDLVQLIRNGRFDTVFSFLVHANTAAAIASRFCPGVRFIQSIQTTQPRPRWHWIVQQIVQHFADRIVVPSQSIATVARNWADVPKEKIVIIPNAVDGPISGLATSVASDFSSNLIRIGFLGRLDPIKRVSDLVQAMMFLDDRFVLHIFGDGPDRLQIEVGISKLGLVGRVIFHGITAKPQAAMRQIDVMVLPSEAEGMPMVAIEAMAAGVPLVATNAPGIRDVVRDGVNGLLVPVGSPKQLAGAIQRIVSDNQLRNTLVQNAHRRVQEKYSWERVVPQYRELLGLDGQS